MFASVGRNPLEDVCDDRSFSGSDEIDKEFPDFAHVAGSGSFDSSHSCWRDHSVGPSPVLLALRTAYPAPFDEAIDPLRQTRLRMHQSL